MDFLYLAIGLVLGAVVIFFYFKSKKEEAFIDTTELDALRQQNQNLQNELSRSQEWRRDKLNDNIQLFKTLAAGAGFTLLPSNTAIQPLIIGDSDKAMLISASLKKQGIWLSAIRPPTVPQGSTRLRITLSALHQSDDIHFLVQKLEQLI